MNLESRVRIKYIITLSLLLLAISFFSVVATLAASNISVDGGVNVNYSAPCYTLKTGAAFNGLIPSQCESLTFGSSLITTNSSVLTDSNYTQITVDEKNQGDVKLYYNESTKQAYVLAKKPIIFNEDSGSMFATKTNLASIKFENIDTSNVIKMDNMFQGSSRLTNLDLTSFNTSEVTSMSQMFNKCANLETIYVGESWQPAVSGEDMFSESTSLVGGSGTVYNSNCVDNSYAVADSLETPGYLTVKSNLVDVSVFKTTVPSDCISITFGLKKDYSSQISSSTDKGSLAKSGSGHIKLYYNESTKEAHILTDGIIVFPKSCSQMFYNRSSLLSIVFDCIDTSNVTNMDFMFSDCTSLTSLDLSNFDTKNVTRMYYMFDSCKTLESLDLSNFNTTNVTGMGYMFCGCELLASLDVSSFDTSKVTNMYYMFQDCETLTSLDLSNFNTSNVTNMTYMFYYCTKLQAVKVSEYWNTDKVTSSSYMFTGCSALSGEYGTGYNSSYNNKTYALVDTPETDGYLSSKLSIDYYVKKLPTSVTSIVFDKTTNQAAITADSNYSKQEVETGVWEYVNSDSTSVYYLSDNTISLNNCNRLFYNRSALTLIKLNNIDTSKTKSMSYMFYNCSNLSELDVSNFNTSKVTNMGYMFYSCKTLESLDMPNFNTSNVTDMGYMFNCCLSLTNLDLSSFKTSNVTNMRNMFAGSYSSKMKLITIFVDENLWSVNNVTVGLDMFSDCNSLVGGNSTTYNSNYIDVSYACVDSIQTPGYLTHFENDLYAAIKALPTSVEEIVFNTNSNQPTIATDSSYTKVGLKNGAIQYVNSEGTKAYYLSDNVIQLTNAYKLFYNRTALKSVIFANVDTSNVVKMNYMFYNCSSLTSLDMTNFNTSNVTDMSRMFYNCSSLTSLDMTNFNTSNVTDMYYMFYSCETLESLDLSNFNTSNVTDMGAMFKECSSLSSLDVSNFNTSNVTNMNGMFKECSSLSSLDVSNFNTANVKYMDSIFSGCSSVSCLDVSNFNTSNVTDMGDMFYNCSLLTSVDVTGFNTSNVTDMSRMFYNCETLERLDLSNFDTKNVTDMDSMFYSCETLESLDLSNFNTSNVTDMYFMFKECSSLSSLDVSSFDTSKVTSMRYMFYYCKKLTILDLSSFDTSNVKVMDEMFWCCYDLTTIYVNDSWNTDKVTSSSSMFYGCSKLVGGAGTVYNSSYIDVTYARIDTAETPGYLTSKGTYILSGATINGLTSKYNGATKLVFDYTSNVPVSSLSNIVNIACKDGNGVVIYGYDVSTKTAYIYSDSEIKLHSNYYGMFDGCSSLVSVEFKNINTENAVDMGYMFNNCIALTSITFPEGFNTSNVTNMGYMFNNCTALTSITFSEGFNTINVTNMGYMFYGCTKLTSLDLSLFDTSKVTNMEYMFRNCSSLTGITFSENFKTDKITKMNYMFYGCSNLKSLDLSSFNTSNVTTMTYMFAECGSLTSVNLTSFNTAKVKDMKAMFANCKKLTELDLSSFNISSVSNTGFGSNVTIRIDVPEDVQQGMFYNCSSLTTIYASCTWSNSRFAVSLTEHEQIMFYGCDSLVGGNGTKYTNVGVDSDKYEIWLARIDGEGGIGYFTYKANPNG